MHPCSRRVGPTSARNSASSNGSCPSRDFSKTMSVTASFDSLPFFEDRRFGVLTLPALRLPADFLAVRLAIMAGIVPYPRQNASLRPARTGGYRRREQSEGCRFWPNRKHRKRKLVPLNLPPRIQVIEIQNRIQHERIRPAGLASINRIDGEQDDVPISGRHVHHRGMLRDLIAGLHQP
jgi:hypothetical protein